MKKALAALALVLALALALAGWYSWGPRHTPAGQPALTSLSPANFEVLRQAFNSASDQVRLVLLLSPT
jgi:hypothetical protein